MKLLIPAAALLSATSALAQSPVQKVISLLAGLESKIIKEGQDSQKTFHEFTEWCEERNANLGYEIKTGTSKTSELQAAIGQAVGEASALGLRIEKTAGAISTNEADMKAASQIRAQEEKDFRAEEKELVEVVDMLTRAVGILEREARRGGASALQLPKAGGVVQALQAMVSASMLNAQDASKLSSLVQEAQGDAQGDEELGAPDAAAYQGHSDGIVETLQDLLEKAEEQLESSRKKEVSAKHNYEMLAQSLTDEVKFGNEDMGEAKKRLAGQREAKASAEGELKVTEEDLAVDKDTVATLKQECMSKSQDFESEVKSRGEELKAIGEAQKVLQEMTSGAANLAYSGAAAFLQLDAASSAQSGLATGADLANFEAVRLVRALARRQHSEALMQLARRMAAAMRFGAASGGDPFGKVKSLIKGMIETLEGQGSQDARHKAYCDKELGETSQKRVEKSAEVSKLSSEIESMSARAAKTKQESAAEQAALAELEHAQAEATRIRSEEKGEYTKNKPEMTAGLEGVKMALKLLREYYSQEEVAHATAEGAGNSVIGLLEVVESDFTRLLADMNAAEAGAQSEFEAATRSYDIEKATKQRSVEHLTKSVSQLNKDVAERASDREGVQAELSAILEYKAKLGEMCIAKPESYEERRGRREAELAGLKEALSILAGEAVLLQRGQRLRGGLLRAHRA